MTVRPHSPISHGPRDWLRRRTRGTRIPSRGESKSLNGLERHSRLVSESRAPAPPVDDLVDKHDEEQGARRCSPCAS